MACTALFVHGKFYKNIVVHLREQERERERERETLRETEDSLYLMLLVVRACSGSGRFTPVMGCTARAAGESTGAGEESVTTGSSCRRRLCGDGPVPVLGAVAAPEDGVRAGPATASASPGDDDTTGSDEGSESALRFDPESGVDAAPED